MAYDEDLAARIRELLSGEDALTEMKMFGGLAFLVGGHMAVSAGPSGLLLRVDPGRSEELTAGTAAAPAVMRGRAMAGWLRVGAEHVGTPRELAKWVRIGADHARSLPPKG